MSHDEVQLSEYSLWKKKVLKSRALGSWDTVENLTTYIEKIRDKQKPEDVDELWTQHMADAISSYPDFRTKYVKKMEKSKQPKGTNQVKPKITESAVPEIKSCCPHPDNLNMHIPSIAIGLVTGSVVTLALLWLLTE